MISSCLPAFSAAIVPDHERYMVMLRTIEATIDKDGTVRLSEPAVVTGSRRVLVTILDEEARADNVTAMSELALAEDWNRPEEEDAWSHLQPAR